MERPIYHEHPVGGIDYPRNLKNSFQMKPPVPGICFVCVVQEDLKTKGIDRKNCNESEVDTPLAIYAFLGNEHQ
jgi:hypothetical protein